MDRCRRTSLERLLVAAAATVLTVGAGCARSERVVTERYLPYAEGLELDVHAPAGARDLPIVILVHGAGLRRGDYTPFAERVAAAGAVVFNADWDVLAPSTELALAEIVCAVRYARDHGAGRGGDRDRVVLVGHSTAAAYAGRIATAGDTVGVMCTLDQGELPDGLALLAPALTPGGSPWPYSVLGRNPSLEVAVVHGVDDRVAAPYRGERTADVLREAGYATTFLLVPGGHDDLVLVARRQPDGTVSTPDARAADLTIDTILDLVGPTTPGE